MNSYVLAGASIEGLCDFSTVLQCKVSELTYVPSWRRDDGVALIAEARLDENFRVVDGLVAAVLAIKTALQDALVLEPEVGSSRNDNREDDQNGGEH